MKSFLNVMLVLPLGPSLSGRSSSLSRSDALLSGVCRARATEGHINTVWDFALKPSCAEGRLNSCVCLSLYETGVAVAVVSLVITLGKEEYAYSCTKRKTGICGNV